jgi:hypothetical protein
MEDPNENWLVKLYYGNKYFFVLMACGADNGLVIAFINGRYTDLQNSMKWNLLVAITATIICMKQCINIGQWTGSVRKLQNYDLKKQAAR